MRAVIQRVVRASVSVDGELVATIGPGLVILLGITHADTADDAATLARKIHGLRILRGDVSLADGGGQALVVSQFTLYGDVRKGRRPSWSAAAPRAVAEPLVDALCARLRSLGADVRTGRFGADMALDLVNDGPVTLVVDT